MILLFYFLPFYFFFVPTNKGFETFESHGEHLGSDFSDINIMMIIRM